VNTPLDRYTALAGNAQVRAFLHVIREGETNQSDDAYRMIYGGALIVGSDHPWYGRTTTEVGHSTAYGAYQFLGTSWKEASDALGIGNDTSPVNQDLCAIWTMDTKRHALQAVVDGDLALACSQLASEWVSLPGLGLNRVQRVFEAFGGTLGDAGPRTIPLVQGHEQPSVAATQPESPMPILLSLLPLILNLFAPRAQAQLGKITGQPPEVTGAFLSDLFAKIGATTGVVPAGQPITTDAQAVQAVAALQKATPEQVRAVESHAMDYMDKLAPMFDRIAAADAATNQVLQAGRAAASARAVAERWDMTPWLVWIAGGTATVLVMALLGAIIWQATTGERAIDTALIGLAGPLLAIAMGVWREIFSYRFDGNPASNSAAALNAAIVETRK